MSFRLKKILAVLIIAIIVVGWVITLNGIGPLTPVKDRMKLGLDIKGGVYVVMEADKNDIKNMSDEELREAMEQTQTVIENRINANGLGEPTVSIEGKDRIRVEIPEVKDPEDAIALIGKTAKLQFILADGSVVLEGGNVKDAAAGRDDQSTGYAVNLEFDRTGANLFADATTKAYNGEVTSVIEGMAGSCIAIVLDDQIISAPNVNEPITGGKCTITGDFTQEEAQTLAAQIKGGSLPIGMNEVTSSVQSASIGYNALEMSILAAAIGLGLILLIMLVAYRGLGVCADIALLLYVLIIINAMSLMGSVLTLPGIAGIILSIGMAVDANVVIFSRIREEISLGRTIRVATETGTKRAMTTVIDSQVTTFIAAIILYEIGTSSVKGFAYTFMIGIFVSIITAVVVTQLYVKLMAQSDKLSKPSFFGIGKGGRASFSIDKTIPFMSKKKVYYLITAAILVIGLVCGLTRGVNYGIDFTGGTMIQMDMGKQVKISDVKDSIEKYDLNETIVYSGDDNSGIIIKTKESLDRNERAKVIGSINKEFGTTEDDVISQEYFGPSVGNELRNNAIKAVLIAAACMLIYIRLRFRQWRFGGSAMLGVLHDVLIVMAFYIIFGVTVNNPFIAAILTVVGYSINDTIVVFDRIRENIRYMKKGTLIETVDKSITQTLGRSLMTSATTLIVMIPMVILAGEAIREFIFPLMVGVIAGAYSSICICSPLYCDFSRKELTSEYEKQVKEAKKKAKKKAKNGYKGIKKETENLPEPENKEPEVKETKQENKSNKQRSKRYVKGNNR
ncbi:MAG: protein translocase subunit SecD [Firmicutes bacterium]|nr:protein translocase subunit SecD [Bacillota bacterium]